MCKCKCSNCFKLAFPCESYISVRYFNLIGTSRVHNNIAAHVCRLAVPVAYATIDIDANLVSACFDFLLIEKFVAVIVVTVRLHIFKKIADNDSLTDVYIKLSYPALTDPDGHFKHEEAAISGLAPSAAPGDANMTTTGMIMKPEMTATNVSAATILTAALGTESRRRM